MSYSRVVQYADIIEYYEYEKPFVQSTKAKKRLSPVERERLRQRRLLFGVKRSHSSISRARNSFFKIVAHNLHTKGVPVLVTLTFATPDVQLIEGYKSLYDFKKNCAFFLKVSFDYIAVPEWQKNGNLHFHLLVWGLVPQTVNEERDTRNLQRQYAKGFLDVRLAHDSSPKLASYLAKYLAKASADDRLGFKRAYTCSRGIEKPRAFGSNTLSSYTDLILPSTPCIFDTGTYDTKWYGMCRFTKYKTS